jgi:nucleoside 2-deoxyribosyltransferase
MPLTCFVIMPFRPDFDAVFDTVREAVAEAVPGDEMTCFWLKDVQAAGRITDDIHNSIRQASLCISELTGNNPNVMWETGYAMALGKPTILIAQTIEDLPFDLKVHRVIAYEPDRRDALKLRLVKAVEDTMSTYALKAKPEVETKTRPENRTIAVTGGMSAVPAKLLRRVPAMLEPWLSAHTRWLTGASGATDEAVLNYLVARGQKVSAVGYSSLDSSEAVRRMVETGKIGFIDASSEPVPKTLAGPSKRDSFFCAKADLVVLFWDGRSQGTAEVRDYLMHNNVSLLLAFL